MRCGTYTRSRYPSRFWTHPAGLCSLPKFKFGTLDHLYLIMLRGREVIGFGDHIYEKTPPGLTHLFPEEAVLATQSLAIIDKYQEKGWGTLYTYASSRIALDNEAHFSLGHTQRDKGMLGIRLKQGWRVYEGGERMVRIFKQIQDLDGKVIPQ